VSDLPAGVVYIAVAGDGFHSLAVVASTTDCVRKQGFWKDNPHTWPVQQMQLGSVGYDQAALLSMLNEPTRRNGLVILTRQLIAAELNLAAGASADPAVQQAIAAAHAMIGSLVPPPFGDGSLLPAEADALATFLDLYNSGQTATLPCE
jgi:hypothetical protein